MWLKPAEIGDAQVATIYCTSEGQA